MVTKMSGQRAVRIKCEMATHATAEPPALYRVHECHYLVDSVAIKVHEIIFCNMTDQPQGIDQPVASDKAGVPGFKACEQSFKVLQVLDVSTMIFSFLAQPLRSFAWW